MTARQLEATGRRGRGATRGTRSEELEGVRRERVEQLLHRPRLTLREVARQAGFSDERALRRAVRRWHGMAPLQLRQGFLYGYGGNDVTSGAGTASDIRLPRRERDLP
ncbi:helix-turn-helix domain-containing protein [Streptomyces sp. NPDC001480]|uniref:helix-turn-helix domain-containing protein n=1 Tax=Streptomyces sp. NPDC001480 TaxID=3364577 RepID=UPI0036A37614